jgi:exodeoxyribonuclease V alpha subunit
MRSTNGKTNHEIPLERLKGQIERITYTNEENGYTIARVKVFGRQDLVTIVGNLTAPTPGEILNMKGQWTTHPKFGEQFKVVYYNTAVPATVYGIRKYLGSGLIKGIGPVIAERIVKQFGENTLDVIEQKTSDLEQVDGIGRKRIAMIRRAWDDQKEIREVMLFLQTHGVSSGYATKIYKQYGNDSISVIQDNPYRLAMDIFGIGFVTADHIAEKMGIAKNSPIRAKAGMLYVLHQLADEGHVYYPYEDLIARSREILEIERDTVVDALGAAALEKHIVIEDLNDDMDNFRENYKAVYLAKFYICETQIAYRLKVLGDSPKSTRMVNTERAIAWVQEKLSIQLARKQIQAIQCAIESKLMVITGGPGTGKTTIISGILKIYEQLGVKIMLAAPTGRAAKRMSETTGHPAKTIHRLLEYSMAKHGFQKNAEHPLKCDLLIIDECSMIDTVLMHHLLKALPSRTIVLFVGDVHQLPSVGAGNVLGDIISSGTCPVVALTEIFRQASRSRIIVNSHKIKNGVFPAISDAMDNDFYFIQKENPDDVLSIILELAHKRIPDRFGFDPMKDIQVLVPMHKGLIGAGNLNSQLQRVLNPGQDSITRGEKIFRVDDKVMQIRNNYDKQVFNGDIGIIQQIRPEDRELYIHFDGRNVKYDYAELDEIVLAYAISIHKSQGSEFPAVIIPILTQHYVLLQRNLIYTAITRGKKLVVMVGTKKALAIGIKNDKILKRYTRLSQRLETATGIGRA